MQQTCNLTINREFMQDKGDVDRSPDFKFYDGTENLLKGVRVDTSMGPREFAEDIPTAVYNPGSSASQYAGFRQ
jgi:hypothetical protein